MTVPALAYAIAPSLADPAGSNPFVAAIGWIEGVALGTVATSIALIAVASIGFLMLGGRLPVRRGATVIAGCFVLFGAPVIAAGLLGSLQSGSNVPERAAPPPSPLAAAIPKPTPLPTPARSYDPYAGAAVPQR